ncbi:synaptotagmin-like protein 3 [Synchiropus splendidus]|uniref:synaptotagmin-like protein 3 n=1 Tax=Synchiropus splendidus TaxID=270530 RepID=UPI00237E6CE1|nr:synaptotagmin-like protein 3 [Synchiropus splendidus]
MDLGLLLALERERVLEVLRRDKLLRSLEEERVRRMKCELQELRRRGAKSCRRQCGERACARCQRALGRVWNTGAVCRGCSHRICSKCRVCRASVGWKCTVCHACREVKVRSGEWFLEERAKKFPVITDKYETVGDNLLKKFNEMSHISVVPPTPPPQMDYPFHSKPSHQDLKQSKPFTKSMEDLIGHMRRLSSSHTDVRDDFLTVDCAERRYQFFSNSQKSLSDTDINKSSHFFKVPLLPNIFKNHSDGSSIGTEEEVSIGSDDSGGKRGSFSSIGTVCSFQEGAAVSGGLQLALSFSRITSCLEITVGSCRDLLFGDPKKRKCHPYVRLYILPEKSHRRKTAIRKNTTDPVFNEVFQIHMQRHLLIGKRLQATVWHDNSVLRKVFLGEVLLPLDSWMLDDDMGQNLTWYPLCPKQPDYPDGGTVEQEVVFKLRSGSHGELLQLSSLKQLNEKDAHHKI